MWRIVVVAFVICLQGSNGAEFVLDEAKLSHKHIPFVYKVKEFGLSKLKGNKNGLSATWNLGVEGNDLLSMEALVWHKQDNETKYNLLKHYKPDKFSPFHLNHWDLMKGNNDIFQTCSNIPPIVKGQQYIWKKVRIVSIN